MWGCTNWSLPNTVQPPRRQQILEVNRDSGPDPGAPLPPSQPVERPAECTLEHGGKGDRLECRQMLPHADLRVVSHRTVRSSGD